MRNLLKHFREERKMTQATLADLIGTSQSQVNRLEHSHRKLTVEWAERIAPHLGIDAKALLFGGTPATVSDRMPVIGLYVEGTVQAGSFRDITLEVSDAEKQKIPVAVDDRFGSARQYALEVRGDSMDRQFPDRSFVTCVSWNDLGRELQPGMILHIERHRLDLVETTLKRFELISGKKWLMPDSSNPNHHPIEINGDENTEILIKGMVTGSWRPIS